MNEFYIDVTTSYEARAAVISLIKSGFVAKTANISYNPSKGLPSLDEKEHYPLILHGSFAGFPSTMKVYAMTAGYPGSGPNDLCKVLKAAGFHFAEEDILTKRKADDDGWIHLIFTR